jgi:uncharacterized membrane protein
VLHFFLLASLLGLAFMRLYWANLGLGSLLVLAGITLQHPLFDQPGLQWVGLMTHKPITEDYVPLLPGFGVFLLGMFLGKSFLRSRWDKRLSDWCGDPISARVLALSVPAQLADLYGASACVAGIAVGHLHAVESRRMNVPLETASRR